MRVVPVWVTDREVLTWEPQALMISGESRIGVRLSPKERLAVGISARGCDTNSSKQQTTNNQYLTTNPPFKKKLGNLAFLALSQKRKYKTLVIYTIYNEEQLFFLICFNSFSKKYKLIYDMYKWLILFIIR